VTGGRSYWFKIGRRSGIAAVNAIAGVKKHLSGVSLTLDGVDYTDATLVALLQSDIDAAAAAVTARATWLLDVQNEKAMHARILAVLAALRSYVTLKFGSGAVDTQASTRARRRFRLRSQEEVVKTAETKAKAAQKAVAARKARHTMGTQQEKAVHGSLPDAAPVSLATTPKS
jgi:hypothetical protein